VVATGRGAVWVTHLSIVCVVAGSLGAGFTMNGAAMTFAIGAIPTDPDPPQLAVAPNTWWMPGGSTEPLEATWEGVPPGCAVVPLWFRWSIAAGGAEGFLSSINGPTTNFTAAGSTSGPTTVIVAAAADLRCGPERSGEFATARSTISVDAPLAVQGFHVAPNSSASPGEISVSGTIAGGTPPYSLSVEWGNHSVTRRLDPAAGDFSLSGLPGPGPVVPRVTVVDADGLVAHATSPENGTGSPTFSIAIDPSSFVAVVGQPVEFQVVELGLATNFSVLEVCEDAGPDAPTRSAFVGSTFSCTFTTPGVANVSVVAVEAAPPFLTAFAQLLEPVVPPLDVRPVGTQVTIEAGRLAYVPVDVLGGVLPARLEWSAVGNGSTGQLTVPLDGVELLPVAPSIPGDESLVVHALDARGEATENETVRIVVDGALSAVASVAARPQPNGSNLSVSSSVLDGEPPFAWLIVTSVPAESAAAPAGNLSSEGTFAWGGLFRTEGAVTAEVLVVDAAGSVWDLSQNASAIPALQLVVAPVAPGPVAELVIEIGGGLPPYRWWANDSQGNRWNGTEPADGRWNLSRLPTRPVPATLNVTIVDALGVRARGGVQIPAGGGGTGEDGSAVRASWLAAGGITALAIPAVWWWSRRRPSGRPPEPPDVTRILRGILEPADGADRGVVELLAEEQGVPAETARRTLDRLIAEGTIRAERGGDGEEILAWREPE